MDPPYEIKDSKKMSAKKRAILRKYIEENALAYSVTMIHPEVIDRVNILQATMKGMHQCLDEICQTTTVSHILVDGTYFPIYTDKTSFDAISHDCPGGDSLVEHCSGLILAKEHRDEYILGWTCSLGYKNMGPYKQRIWDKSYECIIRIRNYRAPSHLNRVRSFEDTIITFDAKFDRSLSGYVNTNNIIRIRSETQI